MPKIPKSPESLSLDGKALWTRILTDWPGIEDAAHLAILHAGIEAWERAARCRRQIDEDGEVVLDRFDQRKPHPLLAAERDSRSQFLTAIKTLGLDPSEV